MYVSAVNLLIKCMANGMSFDAYMQAQNSQKSKTRLC